MEQKHNEQIRLAWNRFRRTYRGILSLNAFVIGDLLYEYADNLANNDTEIIGNHFVLEYNKKWIAQDLQMNDSTFRKKKRHTNQNVWEELEQIGFIIINGSDGICTKYGLPIHINQCIPIDEINIGQFHKNKYGVDKTKQYLINLNEKIQGTYEEKVKMKWYEIDYTKQNINNFKIFEKDTPKQKQTKLSRQFLCLIAIKGIDVQKEAKSIFSLFFKLIRDTHGFELVPYELLEKAIRIAYKKHNGSNLQKIYAHVFVLYKTECEIRLLSLISPDTKFKKDSFINSKREDYVNNLIKSLKKESSTLDTNEQLEFYKRKQKEYYHYSWKDYKFHLFLNEQIQALTSNNSMSVEIRKEELFAKAAHQELQSTEPYNDNNDEWILMEP